MKESIEKTCQPDLYYGRIHMNPIGRIWLVNNSLITTGNSLAKVRNAMWIAVNNTEDLELHEKQTVEK